MRTLKFTVLATFVGLSWLVSAAQCTAPVLTNSTKPNIFKGALETDLGDIAAERDVISRRLIEVPELTDRLNKIGANIAKHLPPNDIKFRFYVVDEGDANAWAFSGGRIYVTRKLISFVKSEDELAAVIAHEMGHQIVHHTAISVTRVMKDAFQITSVRTRSDVEEAYNKLLDLYKTKGGAVAGGDDEKDQVQADQVSVYAMAAAGYNPKAAVEFWDRYADVKGKKGNFLSDFLGETSAEAKRLREFTKAAGSLSSSCIVVSSVDAEVFKKWQSMVRTYSGSGRLQTIPPPTIKTRLQPPLRPSIDFLRFSPDGKYILAQDEISIFILSREPFAPIMRVDADDAYPAQFTPDSKGFVFYTTGLRVERWNIASKQMDDVSEVHAVRGCKQTALSPDGKYLACLEPNPDGSVSLNLSLFDTAANKPVYTRKNFFGDANGITSFGMYLYALELYSYGGNLIRIDFSPDGHYLVAGRGHPPIAVDLTTLKEIPLANSVKKLLSISFAFLGSDRIVGVDGDKGEKGTLVKFPSGDVVMSDVNFGLRKITAPGHGDYVLIRPLLKSPAGVFDLKANRVTLGSKTDALDIYDGVFLTERTTGELVLNDSKTMQVVAVAQLPDAPMGSVRAASISGDQKYVAFSENKRGGIFDLKTGQRVLYLRGFHGVDFESDATIIDFPAADDYVPPLLRHQKYTQVAKELGEQQGHSIVKLDPSMKTMQERDRFQKKNRVQSYAPYLMIFESDKPEENDWSKKVKLSVRHFAAGTDLWTRRFEKEVPGINGQRGSDYTVFTWDLSQPAVKDEVRNDPTAKSRVAAFKTQPEGSYFVEVVDLRNGKPAAMFPVDTGSGSYTLTDAAATSRLVFLEDSHNRVQVYTLEGKFLARFYGLIRAVSKDGKYLLTSAGRGRLDLYDVNAKALIQHFVFESRISHAEFSSDNKQIHVLTRDQTFYSFRVESQVANLN